ncbi:MAG: hypothetical protein LQ351_007232 [Letrouitia transgressa]|nr:MAG: hypothetical protein LQ351_007232 [Letrouitia transgressa]
MLETARDLTLEAAQSAATSRNYNPRPIRDLPFLQVKKLLDSRNDREILEGLRKVISVRANMELARPIMSDSGSADDVSIKANIASTNVEIKKLVYIYLLHYAESEPDLALLSINSIQKSLTDQNPQVRTMALRVMSGIRVPVISQIVSLAIKRGCVDMSPHVRKAAALAIPKCYRLDPNTFPQLLEYLSTLLGDRQYYVVGSAVTAFLEICPDRMDLVHKHYRALVRKLVDMDEWGQLATLRLISIYARKCFPKRMKKVRKGKAKGFYEDEASDGEDSSGEEVQVMDPDLVLFLKTCRSLLRSRNSAVVISVTRCFLDLGTLEDIDLTVGPLVALLRSLSDIQQVAMYNIVAVCLVRPKNFLRYTTHFLVHAAEPLEVSLLKIEVLTLLFPHGESHIRELILTELEYFTQSPDADVVQQSVRAIGRCAQNDVHASGRCLELLLRQISSQDDNLVAQSLTVIRHLIQQNPQAHVKTVIRLAKTLDTTANPEARATIIWLVGEFSGTSQEENIAPDVLRILTRGFADESEAAKLQIVLLAAKVYLHYLLREHDQLPPNREEAAVQPISIPEDPDNSNEGFQEDNPFATSPLKSEPPSSPGEPELEHPIPSLWSYILQLVHYDTSFDLRDRTRTYRALLADPSSTQLASLILLAPKPVPHTPSPFENRQGLPLGSSSLVLGVNAGALGDEHALPDWVAEGDEPDPKLRDTAATGRGDERAVGRDRPAGEMLDAAVSKAEAVEGRSRGKEKSLEDWLGEDQGVDEDEDEEDEDSVSAEEVETESEEETEEEEEEGGTDEESEGDERGEREGLVR